MKYKWKILIILSALFVFIFAAKSRPGIDYTGAKLGRWTMDYRAVLKKAKKYKKPIFINFTGSDWCKWCILMAKNVFSKSTWKKFAKKNLYMAYIDFPKMDPSLVPDKYVERNQKLMQEFGVRGFPTFIVLDYDGTEIGRLSAGENKTPKSFIKEIKDILKITPSFYKKILSKKKQVRLKILLKKKKKIFFDFKTWIDTKPQKTEKNMKIYQNFITKLKALNVKIDKLF